MMSYEVLSRLLANLRASHTVYERLLEIAERKQSHIVSNEIEQLREALKHEERLAADGAELNTERETLHRRCCLALQLGPGADNLDDLCGEMPREWHDRFSSLRATMRRTLERLREVNRLNAMLVNNSIELMDGLLAALFDAEPTVAYSSRGVSRRVTELPLHTLDARA